MPITDRFRNPGRYFLVTFGCQMNISDSERIDCLLKSRGYQSTPKIESADLVIVNMCSIRKSAVDRVYGIMAKINRLKKSGHSIETVLTGCYLKTAEQRKLLKSFDLVCQRSDLFENPDYLSQPACYGRSFQASVPIMTGCNNFCAYCVVPFTRGPEQSRPPQEIIQEVEELVKRNYQEIWLLGQNVNSYRGQENGRTIQFPELLSRVNNIKGDFWLYFTTSHPKDITEELIEVIASSKKVGPYLNLPAQSGDDTILKKMKRPYRIKNYRDIASKLRQAFAKHRSGLEKKLALSTDIIVGFPGESEKNFQNTAQLMKEIKFDMAYIARYSPRPLTSAWPLGDPVSESEKIVREKILTEILRDTALSNNQTYKNQTIPVLINHYDNAKKCLQGRSRSYKKVQININQPDLVGQIVLVHITQVGPWGLGGEIIKNPLNQ